MAREKERDEVKRLPRRDKLKIYGDLLTVLNSQGYTDKIILTRVQVQINVPFDRLKGYLLELAELGLITDDVDPKLTDKGKQYLREYKRVLEFMRRMGLMYR